MGRQGASVTISIECFTGAAAIRKLDLERIAADLCDKDESGRSPDVDSLKTHDQVVVARDRRTGRALAILGGQVDAADLHEYLLLREAFVAPHARRCGIMSRMIALSLLRLARLDPIPRIIACRTANPICYGLLQSLGTRLGSDALFPRPGDNVIPLNTARLARRIARDLSPATRFDPGSGVLRGGLAASGMATAARPVSFTDPVLHSLFAGHLEAVDQLLIVLDLRSCSESELAENARQIYRAR